MARSLSTTSARDSPVHRSTVGSGRTDPFGEATSDLSHWIWSWNLQFERLRESTKRDARGSSPLEIRKACSQTSLDEHLLAVVGRHLVNAIKQYERHQKLGMEQEQTDALVLLRHLYEHWNEQREYAQDPSKPKVRAAKHFADGFPDGKPFTITYADDDWLLGGVVPLFSLTRRIAQVESVVLMAKEERRVQEGVNRRDPQSE